MGKVGDLCFQLIYGWARNTLNMTNLYLHHAFIDEAGSAAPYSQSHYLVIAALCTNNPRSIDRIVRKAQKKHGSSLSSGELKANKSSDKLASNLLEHLAKEDVKIFSVIIDHGALEYTLQDAEETYRWAASRLVRRLVERFPRIEITLDKRYTNARLRNLLEVAIRDGLSDLPHQLVLIRQEDSLRVKELQAVDFVAWAFYQKYERGNRYFYDRIASRIVEEQMLTR